MTTESRMREALEEAERKLFPDGIPQFIDKAALGLFASVAMEILLSEALSPPARRTSYEFSRTGDPTICVYWNGRKWCSRYEPNSDFPVHEDFLAAAIATLAGLTPPEEEA